MNLGVHLSGQADHPIVKALNEITQVDRITLVQHGRYMTCTIRLIHRSPSMWESLDSVEPIKMALTEEVTGRIPGTPLYAKNTAGELMFGTAIMTYVVDWIMPPGPYQERKPTLRYPQVLSAHAMNLLEALYEGNKFEVTWRYRVPYPELDGEVMMPEMWRAFEHELSQQGDMDWFDGYDWHVSRITQHPYTEEYPIERDETHVTVSHKLNNAGRRFVETSRRSVTP